MPIEGTLDQPQPGRGPEKRTRISRGALTAASNDLAKTAGIDRMFRGWAFDQFDGATGQATETARRVLGRQPSEPPSPSALSPPADSPPSPSPAGASPSAPSSP